MILLIAFAAAAATAEPGQKMQRVLVSYSDLDLARSDGVKTLARRVSRVAEQICGSGHAKDYPLLYDMEGCREDVIARALPQVQASMARARSPNRSVKIQRTSTPISSD